jgi:HPt (histidine-containing phosphotransfer) domain-containing protein
MEEKDPQKLAHKLEGEAAQLEDKLESLDSEIAEVRADWLRERDEAVVPEPGGSEDGDGGESKPQSATK